MYEHGGGVLLGILGGGVPNPDPISRPKNVIFHTRFQTRPLKSKHILRPDLEAKIMSSFLRLKRKQKISSNTFRTRIFLLNSY